MSDRGRVVITYGTFDILHEGHLNLLRRAKSLGDYLIVGVTSEAYDRARGKLNVRQSLSERIENVRNTGLVNRIIVEEYEGQKIEDIEKYGVHVFAIGSDWEGAFDYLKPYVDVVYLPRTPGISSTSLRGVYRLGLVGPGRIASRFMAESHFVSGVEVIAVYHPDLEKASAFARAHEVPLATNSWDEFFAQVDIVYIASPHIHHAPQAKRALLAGKHVLAEKPLALSAVDARELFLIAENNGLILLEAIKTAYAPLFRRVIGLARSGAVGRVGYLRASFTKLLDRKRTDREFDPLLAGGALTELGSYVLLPLLRLWNPMRTPLTLRIHAEIDSSGVDRATSLFAEGPGFSYHGFVALDVKAHGDLVVGGDKGYLYVPPPWWKQGIYHIMREDTNRNQTFSDPFHGDGLRYELAHLLELLRSERRSSYLLTSDEAVSMASIFGIFLEARNGFGSGSLSLTIRGDGTGEMHIDRVDHA